MIAYVYDAAGAPIGMQYHGADYADGVWDVYWYEKNIFGDIIAVYDEEGTKLASYVYDAWGSIGTYYFNSGATTTAVNNPFRYRGYYYDNDLNLYYLNARYYDSSTGRFISPDSYVSTGQGILGNNMYAYCGNNPVMRVDNSGQSWNEFWEFVKIALAEAGKAMGIMSPAYAASGAAPFVDGPYPIGDIVGLAIVTLVTVGAIGYGIYSASTAKSDSKQNERDAVISPNPHNQAYFTANPNDFNPRGLVKTEYPGTKNGKIIKWIDPNTNLPVFEWDEDLSKGSHYHILNNGEHAGDHILPNTPVPEPWNSYYFGG